MKCKGFEIEKNIKKYKQVGINFVVFDTITFTNYIYVCIDANNGKGVFSPTLYSAS